MKNITLTDNEGEKISGQLPEGWHEVTLAKWLAVDKADKGAPEGVALPLLVSTLTGLPADVLASDMSLVAIILKQMPWVVAMPTPEPALSFSHEGIEYEHLGNLDKINATQYEALCEYLEKAKVDDMQSMPDLLAALYKPKGKEQKASTVQATSAAFRSLPVDKAWNAVNFFLAEAEPMATRLMAYGQSKGRLLKLLASAEQAFNRAQPRKASQKAAVWLGKRYVRSVKKLL